MDIKLSGENSVLMGTMLAPNRNVVDSRTGSLTGAFIARGVTVKSGDTIHHAAFNPPADNPGQGNSSLSGTLNGPNGTLGGVLVTLTNLNTMEVQKVESGPFGDFTFANLSAGTYSVTVTQDDLDAVTGGLTPGVGTPGTGATDNGSGTSGGVTGIVVDNDDLGQNIILQATSNN
jgi:hypothetical protein